MRHIACLLPDVLSQTRGFILVTLAGTSQHSAPDESHAVVHRVMNAIH